MQEWHASVRRAAGSWVWQLGQAAVWANDPLGVERLLAKLVVGNEFLVRRGFWRTMPLREQRHHCDGPSS